MFRYKIHTSQRFLNCRHKLQNYFRTVLKLQTLYLPPTDNVVNVEIIMDLVTLHRLEEQKVKAAYG